MAKTLVTFDKHLVNYENIVSITVERGEDKEKQDNGDVYGLIAVDVTNNMHVLGVYDSEEKAVEMEGKLRKWLECEAFSVCSLSDLEEDENNAV